MSESNEHDAPRNRLRELVKSRFIRHCSAALVGGRGHAEYLVKLGMPSERVFLGYDAVDNAHFNGGAARARADADATRRALALPERYFLASARFSPKKNLQFLIASYASYLGQAEPGAPKLVILGDGPLRSELEHLRSKLGLDNHVRFHGFKEYNVLPAYYALAELFIHASSREQWGLVVNEAMACGTPVLVSSTCGCARDLLTEGETGYTFDPRCENTLSNRLAELAGQRERLGKMGSNCERVIENWGVDRFAEAAASATETAMGLRTRPGRLDRMLISAFSHL